MPHPFTFRVEHAIFCPPFPALPDRRHRQYPLDCLPDPARTPFLKRYGQDISQYRQTVKPKLKKGRLKTGIPFELHPKSWTSPPTHKVQFFYEQIYITLQIPSRTPLPAYTQPAAYRRPLRHFPNPPAAMDTRLSRRRYRRTRTSPIQNHAPTPQKPLHRR